MRFCGTVEVCLEAQLTTLYVTLQVLIRQIMHNSTQTLHGSISTRACGLTVSLQHVSVNGD